MDKIKDMKLERKNFGNQKTLRKETITDNEGSRLSLEGTKSSIKILKKREDSRVNKILSMQSAESLRAC